jgi:hypothetical protein
MLDALQTVYPTKQACIQVSASDYKKFFKKWDENTSTSPSGKHLGTTKHSSLWATQEPSLTDPADDISSI